MKAHVLLGLLLVIGLLTAPTLGGDWPQFRYDAGRTAATPHSLPHRLELRWTRELPAPRPAFPHEIRLAYDASYEPVVAGRTLFVPSMVTDSVTALDIDTGVERWRFFTEGPVRFAPVAWEGRVYFVSDDGHLYCVDAEDGRLLWKFRGLPEDRNDRRVVGHGRLISLWPARGGPVLADGVVYFAAGLWPTEGVFVHAVDAESGRAVWSNLDSDRIPRSNWDHGVGFYSGLTPQGYLAVVDDQLVVPCGMQLPAFLDLQDGSLGTYTMGWGGRIGLPKGCWFVAGIGSYLSHGGDLYDITRPNEERFADTRPGRDDYKPMLYPGGWTRLDIERANQKELDSFRQPILTPELIYESDPTLVARDLTEIELRERALDQVPRHRRDDHYPDNFEAALQAVWELDSPLQVHIKAGDRLYAGGPGVVEAIDTNDQEPRVVWRAEIEGTPHRMLAAHDMLFVVTVEGTILAFGPPDEVVHHELTVSSPPRDDNWTEKAAAILEATGVQNGFAVVLGIESGRLVEELARQSELHVIAIDDDAGKVAALRQRLDDAGLYGMRASLLVGDPLTYPLPPYVASLVVSETLEQAGERTLVNAMFHALRPYGGVTCVWGSMADRAAIEEIVDNKAFPGACVRQTGEFVMLTRSGALPGAADWSHEEANAASTGASEDGIQSPDSVLWFDASQRWHRQPGHLRVRVSGGRLLVLEAGLLRAKDVYTGRTLWEVDLPIGEAIPDPQVRPAIHRQPSRPRSLAATTELVMLEDAIYLTDGTSCLIFDPATGQETGRFELPDDLDTPWTNLRVSGDYLVGTSGPHVVCVDRRTGELFWRFEAGRAALNLAVGDGKLFVAELANLRRGEDETRDGTTRALDIRSGEVLWERAGGARLRYSPELDLVISPVGFFAAADGRPVHTLAESLPTRLIIEGRALPASGMPGYVAGHQLITGSEQDLVVYDIASAEPLGEPLEWVRRGCTGTRASRRLVTTRYRSNSAWIDLETRQITPFFGVRPGCQINNNLYPANGVLNMPNLTGGCTCNFAPVSLGLVPAETIQPTRTE